MHQNTLNSLSHKTPPVHRGFANLGSIGVPPGKIEQKKNFFLTALWSPLGVSGVILSLRIGISWPRNDVADHTTPPELGDSLLLVPAAPSELDLASL